MTPTTAPPMPVPPASQLALRDIHLPPDVSWWPLAPGWWLLLILLFVLIGSGFLALSRYRRRHFKRIALRQLNLIEQQLQRDKNSSSCVQKVSKLLRHMAVLHYPAEQCAGLHGEEWLNFLNQHFSNDKKDCRPFSHDIGQLLIDLPYQPPQKQDEQEAEEQFKKALALIQLSRRWLKKLPLQTRHGGSP